MDIRNKNNFGKNKFQSKQIINKEICLGDSESSLLEKPALAGLISQFLPILIDYLCKKYYVGHEYLCQGMFIGGVL